MSTALSSSTAQAAANASVSLFAHAAEVAAKPAPARNPSALDVLLITSNEDFLLSRANRVEDLADAAQVPVQTLIVEQLAGSSKEEKTAALKRQLQELHQNGKIDAYTQVIINIHGSTDDGPHRLSNKDKDFSIGTSDMVSLIREAGMGVAQSSGHTHWQGTIHIAACGVGRVSQDLKDDAGMTLLYAGKKVMFSFNSRPIFDEMIRRIGEYRKDPAVNKFPSAEDFFSAAGAISGEKVQMAGQGNLIQIRSGYLPHPTELTQAAVLERLKLTLLAKIAHGKPAYVQKAIDLLGPALSNVTAFPPLSLTLRHYSTDAEEKIKMLLRAGVNVNRKFPGGETALHMACRQSKKEIVALLLQQGANVRAVNRNGRSVLSIAIQEGRLDLIELLVDAGAYVNTASEHGNTALHLASAQGDDRLVDWLLDKGANLHKENAVGETPLSALIHKHQFDRALSLLSRPDQKNNISDAYDPSLIRLVLLQKSPSLAHAILNLSFEKNENLKILLMKIDSSIIEDYKANPDSAKIIPENEILLSFVVNEMLLSNSRMPDYFKSSLMRRKMDKSTEHLEYILNFPGFIEKMAGDLPVIRKHYQDAGYFKGCECIDAALARKASTDGGVVT